MTISDNYVPIRQQGNGVTVDYSSNWNALSAAWLSVNFEDVVTGVLTPQYVGWSAVVANSGFTVTFVTPPPNTVYVVIGRDVDLNQTEPYRTSKGFQGEVVEGAFDKLTAMMQDVQDALTRALKFQLGSTAVGVIAGSPIDTATIVFSGTSGLMIPGPTVGDISGAAAAAATAVAAAATATSAANAAQAAAAGIKYKNSARLATTVNDTLSGL